jgi:hypothetical protein
VGEVVFCGVGATVVALVVGDLLGAVVAGVGVIVTFRFNLFY